MNIDTAVAAAPDRPVSQAQPMYAYLRGLVLWWLIPLAVLACAAVGASIFQLKQDRSAEARKLAQHVADELDHDLMRRLEGLRAVAALTLEGRGPASADEWYRSARAYDRESGMPIMLVDAGRKVLRHSRRPPGSTLPELPQHGGRPAFAQAVESGRAQIGDPVFGPILGQPVVQVIFPVPAQGEVLMGLVPTDTLRMLLLGQALPEGWQATLLDSLGREVASTRMPQDRGASFLDFREQAHLRAAPFSLVMDIDAVTFYKESLFLGALLIFGVLISLVLIAQGARRASLGLVASVRQLVEPEKRPSLWSAAPKIQEIEWARQTLLRAQQGVAAAHAAELSGRAREQFLLSLSDALRAVSDGASAREEGCRQLADFLQLDRVVYAEGDPSAGRLRISREVLRGPGQPLAAEDPSLPTFRVLERLTGAGMWALADTQTCEVLSPGERAACAAWRVGACLGVPILADGRLRAVLWVAQSRPRAWTECDATLVKEVADRLWITLERLATLEALSVRTLELTSQAWRLKGLATELTLAEHRTREQISKTLHDHLQQILFSTSLTLQRAVSRSADDPVLLQVKQGLKEAMEAARSLSLEIFPPALRSEGLPGALRWLAGWTEKKYGLPLDVRADPAADPATLDVRVLLFECVRELIFNAAKHAQARHLKLELTLEPGERVQLVFTDDGIGFDPRQSLVSGGPAPGLGLFTIAERLSFLGGQMRVESEPGLGSRFVLITPLRQEGVVQGCEEAAAPHLPKTAAQGAVEARSSNLRILLVDDHAMVRDGLRQLIGSCSHLEVVGEALDGAQALAQVRALQPDVVVMDRSMPVLDGVGATRKILNEYPETIVLGMSMDEGDAPEKFRQAGAAGFFSKKDGAEQLLQRLEAERWARYPGGGGLTTVGGRPVPPV